MRYREPVKSLTVAPALGLCAALACATPAPSADAPRAPPPALPSAPSAVPSALGSATPSAPIERPRARLEIVAAPKDERAHVEILFPFSEQRILIPKAQAYKVRTKIEGWSLGASGKGVLIALDLHRPRRVLAGSEITLGSLVDAGKEIASGPHWLVLGAVDEGSKLVRGSGASRAPFAAVRFWVGDRDKEQPPGPAVALLSPAGTLNGEVAADAAAIDFLAVPARLGRGGVRVAVSGGDVRLEQKLTSWQPVSIRDLPSGDFSVEVALLDEHGQPDAKARAERTISVNRELGPPPAKTP